MKKEKTESNSKITQREILLEYLNKHVTTRSMPAEATESKQKNYCYYKAELQKVNLLCEVDFLPCRLTGFKALYLTTNPTLKQVAKNTQLSLFSGGAF